MTEIKGAAHIGIAVENINEAVSVFANLFGGKLLYKKEIPEQKQISALVSIGQCSLELMEPTDENAVVAKYLKSKGQGVHHISLEVEGLPQLITDLEEKGAVIIGKSLEGPDKIAFLHPKSALGILFELTERGKET